MRKLKFRAWSNGDAVMIYDLNSIKLINGELIDPIGDYELMQFTGLIDCNEKEIYIGDIVDVYDYYGPHTRVMIDNNEFLFRLTECRGDGRSVVYRPKLEVIGNIYQNKELIPEYYAYEKNST